MIRIRVKKRFSDSLKRRMKSKAIIRKKVSGTSERPRMVVFRSHKHIYAQLVDDISRKTLTGVSTLKGFEKKQGRSAAEAVGEKLGAEAQKKGIKKVVFDRNGYVYHGRVKAVADGARKAGLIF